MYATPLSSFLSWNRGLYIWQTWPQCNSWDGRRKIREWKMLTIREWNVEFVNLFFTPYFLSQFVLLLAAFAETQIKTNQSWKSDFILTSSLKWLKSAKFGCCTFFCGVFSETLIKWETWKERRSVINQSFPSWLVYVRNNKGCSPDIRAH